MPLHVRTPLWPSMALAEAVERPVLMKMECFQPPGSFKLRGMGAAVERAVADGARSIVCSSGGNAGIAVAHAGRRLGVPVTIVVPVTTNAEARSRIHAEGAAIIEHGAAWDDAHAHALTLAREPSTTYVHPFDDPVVWSGHATMVDELVEDLRDWQRQAAGWSAMPTATPSGGYIHEPGDDEFDEAAHIKAGTPTLEPAPIAPAAVVVSVGGGGLLCGLLEGMERVGWGQVPVLTIETEGAASLVAAIEAGQPAELERIDTIATTLGARRVADKCLWWADRRPLEPYVVTDSQALVACKRFLDDHRILVEPACGAALAALYEGSPGLHYLKAPAEAPIVVIVCGGAGVSLPLLLEWAQKLSD